MHWPFGLGWTHTIIMVGTPPRILASYFHTPGGESARLFYTVLRAGHIRASPDYRVERTLYPGHDLLFCAAGAGWVRCADKTFAVSPSQLAWIDGRQPHAHWADPEEPWSFCGCASTAGHRVYSLKRCMYARRLSSTLPMIIRGPASRLSSRFSARDRLRSTRRCNAASSGLMARLFESHQHVSAHKVPPRRGGGPQAVYRPAAHAARISPALESGRIGRGWRA